MKITKRDEKGQALPGGVSLSSEEAAEMARKSHGAGREAIRAKADKILLDLGINPSSADESLVSLATIAAEGKSGAVPALRYLHALLNAGPENNPDRSKAGNDKLPAARPGWIWLQIPVELAKLLLHSIEQYKAESGAGASLSTWPRFLATMQAVERAGDNGHNDESTLPAESGE